MNWRIVSILIVVLIVGTLALLGLSPVMSKHLIEPIQDHVELAEAAAQGRLAAWSNSTVDMASQLASQLAGQEAITLNEESQKNLETSTLGGSPTWIAYLPSQGEAVWLKGDPVEKLNTHPVILETFSGTARDGEWSGNKGLFHLATSPVYQGSLVKGVVVLAWPYTTELIARLTPNQYMVSITGKHSLGNLPDSLTIQGAAGDHGELQRDAWLPKFFPLGQQNLHRYLYKSSPLYPPQSEHKLVVTVDRNEPFIFLARLQVFIMSVTLLIVIGLGLLGWSVVRSTQRPLEAILNHLSELQNGTVPSPLGEGNYRGSFLRLVKHLNSLIAKISSRRSSGGGTANFTNKMDRESITSAEASMASISAASVQHSSPLKDMMEPVSASSTPPQLSSLFQTTAATPSMPPPMESSVIESIASTVTQVPQNTPSPFSRPIMSLDPPMDPVHHTQPPELSRDDTQLQSMPVSMTGAFNIAALQESLAQAQASSAANNAIALPSSAPPAAVRTQLAPVSSQLLDQSAHDTELTSEENQHIREVYDRFLETRRQCGESLDEVTYDRFMQKLLKNRRNIMEKHPARTVMFEVYIKEGKAALRATPMK